MSISVVGAGAFGTALAIAFARAGTPVTLIARDEDTAQRLEEDRQNRARLPGHAFPEALRLASGLNEVRGDVVLLSVPTQQLPSVLKDAPEGFAGKALVACCKGIDLETLKGPTHTISTLCPGAVAGVLTGPSFAVDIAAGLPTALTLATADATQGEDLQAALRAPTLRLYRTQDCIGAELGGALKNVMAIACGAVMGAGLGESARAALVTRGFAEMQRLALHLGAQSATLSGLSGFGDLVLTCTSPTSRNYRFGEALARGETLGAGVTVEGASTAVAAWKLARAHGIDMPITAVIVQVMNGDLTVAQAMAALLARPQTKE